MKITIKTLPPSKNIYQNWHWAKRSKFHNEIREEIWYEMVRQNIKAYNNLSKASIVFKLYFKDNRRRDTQNYLGGGLISVLDSLVDLGVIIDDNHTVIGDPKVEIYKNKGDPRMEIIVKKIIE